MGSWSVYCGISKIAITDGDKCVLLPIKKNKYQNYRYFTYQPAVLPIFGTYNDYGGLENIERDINTDLIEQYFGVDIATFVAWFTEETTYQRDDVSKESIINFEEIKDWSFMWIDREVYNFMSTHIQDKGHLDFGNSKILELIGFIKKGETTDKRFKDKWIFEDKELWSDGRWSHKPDNGSIFYFNSDSEYALSNYINIPEDKKWIGEKSMIQLWEYLDDKKVKEMFLPILTGEHYDGYEDILDSLKLILPEEELANFRIDKSKNIIDIYRSRIREFGILFSELVNLANNLRPMSATFEPYILYLTPQCGEFQHHQILLDKFAEINKSKTGEYDDEMD